MTSSENVDRVFVCSLKLKAYPKNRENDENSGLFTTTFLMLFWNRCAQILAPILVPYLNPSCPDTQTVLRWWDILKCPKQPPKSPFVICKN